MNSDDRAELYRLAYVEGQRTLDDQRDELNGIRGRAAQFMAFIGTASAFLIGSGIRAGESLNALAISLAVGGSILTLATVAFCAKVLDPSRVFRFRMSSKILIDKWIDRDVPGPNEADLLKGLAEQYHKMQDLNEEPLRSIRWNYLACITAGTLGIFVWGIFVVVARTVA